MPPAADAAFLQGLDFFDDVVRRVPSGHWERPSPCAGWRAIDVLGHVGAGVRFGTTLLRQGNAMWKPVDPPGGAVEGDPARWWAEIVEPARAVVSGVDLSRVVDAPRGPRAVGEGLSFPALDLFVHAWDLGRSIGVDVVIPDDAVEFGHALIDPLPERQVRSPSVFADEVTPAASSTPTEAFIAWTGRDPSWTAD